MSQTRNLQAGILQVEVQIRGMEIFDLNRVRELEAENSRLNRMYADLALENTAMKDLIAKK